MADFVDDTFIHWATERDKIRARKEAGIPRQQWTQDEILRDYRFCNVSREDDRGTIAVRELIRQPMDRAGAAPEELCKAMAIARLFNLPSVLMELRKSGAITELVCDLEKVHRVMTERMARGETCFSSAYMVGAPPGQLVAPFLDSSSKIDYVCSIVKRAEWPKKFTSRQSFVKELNKSTGFKDFMSGQIAADLSYTYVLQDARDHMSWAPFGPGAVRGMNLALGRSADARMKHDEYLRVGIAQMEALPEMLVKDRKLTLHDVASNVNCETFKYLRVLSGGNSRRYRHAR